MTYNSSAFWSNRNVIDSGVSRNIIPISSDFVGKISPIDAPIQGLSATTTIKGICKLSNGLYAIQKYLNFY